MKAKRLLLLSLICFPFFLFSQSVTEKKAETTAKNFYFEKLNQREKVSYEDIKLLLLNTKRSNEKIIYRVYEIKGRTGFIIVSGDERLYPILGYSFESNYFINKSLPPNLEEWMTTYELQIAYANKQNIKSVNPAWDKYSVIPDLSSKSASKDVAPLIPCNWGQSCTYNDSCPEDASGPCGHALVGCVAVSQAQVMKYHEHPLTGVGSHSYTHYVYGLQSVDFSAAAYDWAGMTNSPGNAEVAELMYHCGVSVNMNYGPGGSGSYTYRVSSSLKEYFDYSLNNLFTYKNGYTEDNWVKLLKAELDAGCPLVYQGISSYAGHAFNIDGYEGTDHFHVNWGWGGGSNGYFYLDELLGFTGSQACIAGVLPKADYPGINCSSPIILTAGTPYSGTTTTSENIVNKYGSAYYHSTGKEVVHQITTSFPGRLRANISGLNGNNLDVFILSDCNQDSLSAYGDTTAFADDTEPGIYFIVVDGRNGYEGDYTLTVTVPTGDPDLIITEQLVAPNRIETGQIGHIGFKISNIGNSSAPASKTNIWYSEDVVCNGSDIFIEQINIPALDENSHHSVSQNIIIPAGATEGYRYILFTADAENDVIESDEIYNIEFSAFNVPAPGIMDCTNSVSLNSGNWYYGNTETDGEANIETYSCGMTYSDKEVIHTITATHNGVASIEFSEKIPGQLNLMPLTSCNENTCMMNYMIWNPEDTLIHESMQVYAGITYYFVVDAEEGISGNYSLKVNMPGACPDPYISYQGDIDLCESDGGVNLFTNWAYTDIQWYKDNVPIEGQTWGNLWVIESGDYKVEIIENGCSGFSETVQVRFSPEPSHAIISALGDTTFCERNNVTLDLNTGVGYSVQWMKNGNPIEGETALNFIADETGIYTAEVTNISCSVNSNTVEVTVDPVTADIGEFARVNIDDLISHFSCDINDNIDLSGNGNDYFNNGGGDYPEDRNGNWNKSHYYNGQWDNTTTTNSFDNPNVFSLSLWFKTSTTLGGRLIGLGDVQWGISTNSDRMIYMDDAGKLYFGVWDGSAKTVSTAESYNDNNWHSITASLSDSGMKLYVDGDLKAEDLSVTSGANYIGWWKLAYDHIDASFPGIPTSLYYKGIIDDVRIYERELFAGEVSYLFEETLLFEASLEQDAFCEPSSTNVILSNTEAFIEYQLRNDADDSPVGSAVTGNAESINLPTGMLSETTTFNILATNLSSSCSFELNDLFTASINDLPTATLTGGATICEGETTDITIDLTGTAPWDITYTDGTNTFNETSSDNPFVFAVLNAGTYEITALSDLNCTGTDFTGQATVIVNELPNVDLGEDVNITTDESVILDAGPNFISYLWSDGSTEQTLTLSGSYLGIGSFEYSVSVEDINTCENSDTVIVNVEAGVSVAGVTSSEIIIYPNPTTGIISLDMNNSNSIIDIKITDEFGRLIKHIKINDDPYLEIDLSEQAKGIYFIHIQTEKRIIIKKIVLQ